ncbi:hypothetical protein GEV33_014463 [Tenebrio molitor]|uniref:Uncharacterized protein n=1 Tax=Tenebrio molitor TaxID=7067 RepID=A0A8J6L739_TENMO|nr:hypothetical protein GEV33_014463 [Tenebrio molitor]
MGKSIFILGQSRKQSTKMAEINGSGLINESFLKTFVNGDIPVIGGLALSPGVKEPRLHKLRAPDDIIPYSIPLYEGLLNLLEE